MRRSKDFIFVLFVSVLLSFCSMGYELLIARFLSSISSDAVLSQSLTVGCFLLSLGFGAYLYSHLNVKSPWKLLADVEIGIAALAATGLPLLAVISLFMTSPRAFVVLTQILTLLIGTLSGLELPALIEAATPYSKRAFGWVLAANYFGSLIVSLLLPTFFLPTLGLYLTAWFFAICTSFACVLAFARAKNFRLHPRYLGLVVVICLPIYFSLHEREFEQFYLKSYYLAGPASLSPGDIESSIQMQRSLPRVLRFSSPYQDIDIVKDDANLSGGVQTNDFHLFIDQRNQFGSESEIIYHDTMVHGSINMARRVPKSVLVIGGGDGLIAHHLLTYPEVASIRQVELDPKMILLANHFKPLTKLNGSALTDPRVHVEIADGFSWLRQNKEMFDAILIDLPHPISVDLSRLYSVEFYRFVHQHLKPDGFMTFDFPFDGLLNNPLNHVENIDVMRAITKAVDEAGFQSRAAFGSWESFMIATPRKTKLDFNYESLRPKIDAQSVINMARTKIPEPTTQTQSNSIFKPVTIKIQSVRGS